MHLDSKLMWQKHISESLDKTEKAMFSLDNLLAQKSRRSLNKLLLYKSYVRPILTYSSVVYWGTAKFHLENIQIFQKKILHWFTKAFRYICNDVIYKDLNIRPYLPTLERENNGDFINDIFGLWRSSKQP